jgi:hypothetical protein
MTWQAVVLAAVGSFQVVALAWIGARQQQVKKELEKVNGRVEETLGAVLTAVTGPGDTNVAQLRHRP